jgi:hypothetical protein
MMGLEGWMLEGRVAHLMQVDGSVLKGLNHLRLTPVSEVFLSAAVGRNQNTRAKNAKKPREPRQNEFFSWRVCEKCC